MIKDDAMMIPVVKRTGLKRVLPRKVITIPPIRKMTNMGHLLLENQFHIAES